MWSSGQYFHARMHNFPQLQEPRCAIVHHWTQMQHQMHFGQTLLILALEIHFNFHIDVQCAEKAIFKIVFPIWWNLEENWHLWHTWALCPGVKDMMRNQLLWRYSYPQFLVGCYCRKSGHCWHCDAKKPRVNIKYTYGLSMLFMTFGNKTSYCLVNRGPAEEYEQISRYVAARYINVAAMCIFCHIRRLINNRHCTVMDNDIFS